MTMTNGDRDTRDITRDTDLSDADARALAREAWRADPTLTGAKLGERYGDRSAEWGRKQIRAARGEDSGRTAPPPVARPDGTGNGTTRPVRPTMPERATERRPPSRGTRPGASVAVRRVTAGAVTLVAVVAAAASYSHMHALALEAGEGTMAWVLPLSVDGLVVAATMTLLSARRAGRRAGVLPWLALLLGLGASLAANVAAAEPTVVGRLVAAWPPVALALSFELLLRQTRGER